MRTFTRTFTTDGPVDQTRHYVLPAAPRLAEAYGLVEQGAYFVLRSPVRTGKTTALRALAAKMTAEGRYAVLVCSAKLAAPARADVLLVQEALLSAIRIAADADLPREFQPPAFPAGSDTTRLYEGLAAWAQVCPLPIVLFFDDLDSLYGAALECVLRQFETGFSRRSGFGAKGAEGARQPQMLKLGHFPWSIGLVSAYDLRQTAASEADVPALPISTGPFEHFWASRLLPPFTLAEIRALYAQHFGEIDQCFTPDALVSIHEASAGHPFYVQALGRELAGMSTNIAPFTKSQVLAVSRRLIARFVSPIDALATRLLEPRVRHVVEPLLAGSSAITSVAETDVQFVRDIGLLAANDPVRIDGVIHNALIPRLLAQYVLRTVTEDPAPCFDENGKLVMEQLLSTFTSFYTARAAELLPLMPYSKIAQELVFLGFLLHMVEGRGSVDIEFGTSRGRIDVTVSLPLSADSVDGMIGTGVEQREVFVLLARRKGDSRIKKRGVEWLDVALLQAASDSGTLVIFDKRDKRDKRLPDKRIKLKEMVTEEGKTVRLLRA